MTVLEYLSQRGIQVRKQGRLYFASSPFSRDSNWSFCVYPHTDSFYDWSTGKAGDAYKLASLIEGITYHEARNKYDRYKETYTQRSSALHAVDARSNTYGSTGTTEFRGMGAADEPNRRGPFNWKKYAATDAASIARASEYAASRGITRGYFPGKVLVRQGEGLKEKEALGFLHSDAAGNPCGVKFRFICSPTAEEAGGRFTARGRLGVYTPTASADLSGDGASASGTINRRGANQESFHAPRLAIIEGEANANSLWEYFQARGLNDIVISGGGVGKPPPIPYAHTNLPRIVIIDYDGNEELYQERVKPYKQLNATPIKLILPKGEDINSLYTKNQMYLIENLL